MEKMEKMEKSCLLTQVLRRNFRRAGKLRGEEEIFELKREKFLCEDEFEFEVEAAEKFEMKGEGRKCRRSLSKLFWGLEGAEKEGPGEGKGRLLVEVLTARQIRREKEEKEENENAKRKNLKRTFDRQEEEEEKFFEAKAKKMKIF